MLDEMGSIHGMDHIPCRGCIADFIFGSSSPFGRQGRIQPVTGGLMSLFQLHEKRLTLGADGSCILTSGAKMAA